MKNATIQKFNTLNIKSPRKWRDNLINFRIRRKIINRETSLTEQQKEQVYNGSNMSKEEMEAMEKEI